MCHAEESGIQAGDMDLSIQLLYDKFLHQKDHSGDKMNLFTKQRLTELENKLIATSGEGTVRELGMDKYTLVFKMDNQQGTTVQHM